MLIMIGMDFASFFHIGHIMDNNKEDDLSSFVNNTLEYNKPILQKTNITKNFPSLEEQQQIKNELLAETKLLSATH